MKITFSKIYLKKLYDFFCFLLLIINVILISIEYNKYQTDTQAAFYIPKVIKMPKISLCFNMNTLLIKSIGTKHFDEDLPVFLDKTLGQVMNEMPQVDNVIGQCSYRNVTNDIVFQVNDSVECSKIFNIKRYRVQTQVCYLLSLKGENYFRLHSTLLSINSPGLLFSFKIEEPLNIGHGVLPLIHFDETPNDDRIFNLELFPSATDNELFQLSFDLLRVTRLPSPYETHCQIDSRLACICNCTDPHYKKLGYIPIWAIADDISELHHFKIPNLTNQSLALQLNEIEVRCEDFCNYEACRQNLVKTFASKPFNSSHKLVFEVRAERFAYRLDFKAKFLLGDYIERCFNFASIWIDFSIISTLLYRKKLSKKEIKSKLIQLKKSARLLLFRTTNSIGTTRLPSIKYPKKENKSKKLNKFANIIIHLITYSAFIWQVNNVFSNYFQYKTIVKYTYTLNPTIKMPSVVICFEADDIVGEKKVLIDGSESKYDEILSQDELKEHDLVSIFNLTWDDDVLYKCRFRNLTDQLSQLELLTHEECLEKLSVRKFYLRRQICYDLVPKENRMNVTQIDVRFLISNLGTLYSVIINPKAGDFERIQLNVHLGYDLPVNSIEYAVLSPKTSVPRIQQLSYSSRMFKRLPAPYETKCLRKMTKANCIRHCTSEIIDKLNRLPYGSIIDKPKPLKVLGFNDLKNTSINDYWRTVENKCDTKCNRESCYLQFTQTYISNSLSKYEFDVEFIIDLAAHPPTQSIHYPRTTFYDLYYQIFSCLAFWLGFALITYNPFSSTNKKQLNVRKNENTVKINELEVIIDELKKATKLKMSKLKQFKMKFSTLNYKRILIYLFCLTGCSVHILSAFKIYFEFHSIIWMQTTLESTNDYSLIICLQYSEIIGSNLDLTIGELLKITPDNSSIIEGCGYHGFHNKLINDLSVPSDRIFFLEDNKNLCESLFNVEKYILPESVCYKMKSKKILKWNRMQMLNSFLQYNPLSAVVVKSSLLTSQFSITLVPGEEDPISSIFWSPMIVKKHTNMWYGCSYTRFQSKLLPFPYSDEGFTNKLFPICMINCMNKFLGQKNKSYVGLFKEPNNFTFTSNTDRLDEKFTLFI